MRRVKKFIGSEIWYISESFNISLGRFAPIVFGWMVGVKGNKKQ